MTKKVIQVHPEGHAQAGQPTGLIVFTFDDNSTETFDGSKVPGFDLIPEADRSKFLGTAAGRQFMHGGSQKIGDSYAGAAGSDNPIEYAKLAVRETIAQLYRGEWRATTAAGPRVSDLARALSRVTGKPVEAMHAFVEGLSDDEKKVWKAKGKVKAMLATIAAEKAAERAAKLLKAAEVQPTEQAAEEEINVPG